MLSPLVYYALLIAVASYAFLRGRSDERMAAVICIVATVATRLLISPLSDRYSGLETGVPLVDMMAFLGFFAIPLPADRFGHRAR